MIRKLFILLLLVLPFVSNFETKTTYACSCAQPGSAMDELTKSDFVFSGKVKDIVDYKKGSAIFSSADPLQIYFEVDEIWKGINETEVLVVTERDSSSCGVGFTIDDEYLVYGNIIDGKKHVSLCSKTTSLKNATTDLNELGEGKLPTTVVTLENDAKQDDSKTNSQMVWILITFGIVLILGSSLFIWSVIRRKKV